MKIKFQHLFCTFNFKPSIAQFALTDPVDHATDLESGKKRKRINESMDDDGSDANDTEDDDNSGDDNSGDDNSGDDNSGSGDDGTDDNDPEDDNSDDNDPEDDDSDDNDMEEDDSDDHLDENGECDAKPKCLKPMERFVSALPYNFQRDLNDNPHQIHEYHILFTIFETF